MCVYSYLPTKYLQNFLYANLPTTTDNVMSIKSKKINFLNRS